MKGIIGAILIYLTYVGAGVLLDTIPLNYIRLSNSLNIFIIMNLILVLLLYISARIVNQYKGVFGIAIILIWYLISTVYGVYQMKKKYDSYISDNWNGFFSWDFALWEWGVPMYIGTAQLVLIASHYMIKIIRKEWKSNKEYY